MRRAGGKAEVDRTALGIEAPGTCNCFEECRLSTPVFPYYESDIRMKGESFKLANGRNIKRIATIVPDLLALQRNLTQIRSSVKHVRSFARFHSFLL